MQGSIAIQVLPETNRENIFNKVDKVIAYIDQTGLDYEVGAFETTVDGEFDELMDIIKKAHELMLEEDMDGVNCYIKTSFRKNGDGWSIEDKTKKYRK
ncbi:MAG: thiamine-binding protein [Anaerococcus sp.]|uniref:thiamine-binding protein n=1 Tax=Anaerococcus sp. TaxID=1872515 RepID=UPI00290C74BC|nr:thiamine-binding protein [Anaerococcus sp.]MDU7411189.1 thiamine-binding protein [Anaerococcus sp.]